MKIKITLTLFLISFFTFGQTNEINNLAKIINKSRLTENYLADYITISKVLDNLAHNDAELVYTAFFKARLPLIYIEVKKNNLVNEYYTAVTEPAFISKYNETVNNLILLEQKSGDKKLTDKLISEQDYIFLPLNNFADKLHKNKIHKEAAQITFNVANFEINRIDLEFAIFDKSNTTDKKALEIKRDLIYKKTLLNLEKSYSQYSEDNQIKSLLMKVNQVLNRNQKFNTLK